MNWTLEVVIVPVSDLDQAKAFYADQLGFNVDHDSRIGDNGRIVQLTPPGSGCSIVIGQGLVPEMPPGSLKGLQLVVPDIHAAHAELTARGVEVSEVTVLGENPNPRRPPTRQRRVRLFQRPGWQLLGGPADLQPRVTGRGFRTIECDGRRAHGVVSCTISVTQRALRPWQPGRFTLWVVCPLRPDSR
jgi:catechol 2,3-dioxygenase-like lactoylglutathione lyase family enzyme